MREKQRKARRSYGLLWILPSLAGVVVFYLLPFLDVVRRSFLSVSDGQFAGLSNYREVFGNAAFQLAVKNTLKFTAVCIPLLISLGLLCAMLLSAHSKKTALKGVFLLPMALPAVSVALLWRILFHGQGLVNHWLSLAGLEGQDWMNTPAAFWILVFSYVWKNLGYTIVLWLAGLSGISQSVYEAAKIDGAGGRQRFFWITLPCLKPCLYTITVLSFLNSFKVFREAYLVAGNYPQEKIYLLQHLFNNWFVSFSFDKMAAAAVSEGIVLFAVILVLQRMWGEWK